MISLMIAKQQKRIGTVDRWDSLKLLEALATLLTSAHGITTAIAFFSVGNRL